MSDDRENWIANLRADSIHSHLFSFSFTFSFLFSSFQGGFVIYIFLTIASVFNYLFFILLFFNKIQSFSLCQTVFSSSRVSIGESHLTFLFVYIVM